MRRKIKVSYAQTQIPFSGTARALISPFARERKAMIALASIAVLMSVAYSICITLSITHVAAREDALRASRALSADIATRESQYFAEARGITEEYARGLGYVPSKSRTFITRLDTVSYAPDAR